jgi:tetratricopeptide (TPR) repeat protein
MAAASRPFAAPGPLLRALIARAPALLKLGRRDEAAAVEERVVALAAGRAPVLFQYASALQAAGRPAEAVPAYARVVEVDARLPAAWANLSKALLDTRQLDSALQAADIAVEVDPGFARGHAQRGVVLRELGRVADALEALEKAASLAPDDPAVLTNRGTCRLLLGDLPGGFADHEHRWRIEPTRSEAQRFRAPLWLGREPLDGKTILLHAEQGFGDTLHFCRYAALAAAEGARVALQAPRPLLPLLQGLDGVAHLVSDFDPLPPFDLHCPLMSLPLAFGTTLDAIPGPTAYLQPPPDRVAAWRERLGEAKGPRIGIAWFGKPTHVSDAARSIALARFVDALPQGAEIVSLHDRTRLGDPMTAYPIRRFEGELRDFADTAALASQLDLVISVDTSVAHLAAAIGRPTFVLLPFAPDWRWLLDRGDSPWYPAARLFRQPALGDWDSLLPVVRREAAAFLAG